MSRSYSFRKVYGAATIIAVITLAGLLFALFGDGMWDELSWCALAIPLVVLGWKIAGKGREEALLNLANKRGISRSG